MTQEKYSISCPNCAKKYAIPEGSIGFEGRTVKCISCFHSWHAIPEDVTQVPIISPPSPPEAVEAPEAPLNDPRISPKEQGSDLEPSGDEARSTQAKIHRKRKVFKLVTALAATVAAIGIAGTATIFYQSFQADKGEAVLQIKISEAPVRQKTADGGEAISTRAEIINSGTAPGAVPDLRATMRTPDGKVVRQWKISPSSESLAPNSSTSVQIGTSGPAAPPGPLTLDLDTVKRQPK